jgi:hypothetical protein
MATNPPCYAEGVDVAQARSCDRRQRVPKDDFRQLVDEAPRRELQIGFARADVGDVADWDIEQILADAHGRHSIRTS